MIIIIMIIITIIIIKTILSLKIWEVFRNSASYSLIVTFTRRKNTGMSAAATTYLTPLVGRILARVILKRLRTSTEEVLPESHCAWF